MNRLPPLIAVVDDEESVRRALQRLLQSAGFDVEVYPLGAAFLESLAQRLPSCVVLDLHMPGVNGFDVQEAVVRDYPQLPIVVITGYETPETRARVEEHGAKAYLNKPVDAMVLLSAINTAIGRGIRSGRSKPEKTGKPGEDKA